MKKYKKYKNLAAAVKHLLAFKCNCNNHAGWLTFEAKNHHHQQHCQNDMHRSITVLYIVHLCSTSALKAAAK